MNESMNKTIEYYDNNVSSFVETTVDVPFTGIQDEFLGYLPSDAHILDFGCGSGRDTKYFLRKGYHVDAVDGSKEMCKVASAYTGISVRQMLFQELDAVERYDGIWACSSILHLPWKELEDVFAKMIRALKPHGIIYTSFKYSDFEGIRSGRYFTDMTEERFERFLDSFQNKALIRSWVTSDVRPGRDNEKWLNLILQKNGI